MMGWVVIPTLNEAGRIGPLVRELRRRGFRVVVADGGSRDGTVREARESGAIVVEGAGHLGESVRAGAKVCRGEWVGVMDGDGQHRVEDMVLLWWRLRDGIRRGERPDMVLGARARWDGLVWWRRWLTGFLTVLIRARCGVRVSDPLTGMAVVRRSLVLETKERGFKWILEILLTRKGLVVVEVPIWLERRAGGKSKAGIREGIRVLRRICTR